MADRVETTSVPNSTILATRVDPTSSRYEANMRFMADLMSQVHNEEEKIREGGGAKAVESQHSKGRLTARERIGLLADPGSFFELGIYSASGMYEEWGGAPAAGVITGLARVQTRLVMIIANDATVKAGAFFPMTAKKVIRAQNISIENRIPTIYLVDSAGVFLPLQEDVFPDTDDFGRVFRNNAVMSALGISQIAAIMGMCVAGGGYLPVMCDHVLMTDGSGLFLAGPALVQAAIGQKISAEELGGAAMHSGISGFAVGIVANQKLHAQQTDHEGHKRVEFGGVIYTESAEKAARFIMDCNQNLIPLIFLHDVNGFMVGRDAEWSGIIKAGAKMVNAVSNSVVPKITVIVGGSFGAGHYAMCGKAYDPRFVFAWPTARYAVMSGDAAAETLVEIKIKQLERQGKRLSEEEKKKLYESVRSTYERQTDPRYAAARLWVDAIIDPAQTREALVWALEAASLNPEVKEFKTGVLQT